MRRLVLFLLFLFVGMAFAQSIKEDPYRFELATQYFSNITWDVSDNQLQNVVEINKDEYSFYDDFDIPLVSVVCLAARHDCPNDVYPTIMFYAEKVYHLLSPREYDLIHDFCKRNMPEEDYYGYCQIIRNMNGGY